MNEYLVIAISVLIGAGIVSAGVLVYPILRNKVQGYPYETEIEKALLPLIYQAICAAYKLSEESAKAAMNCWTVCPRLPSPTVSATFYRM